MCQQQSLGNDFTILNAKSSKVPFTSLIVRITAIKSTLQEILTEAKTMENTSFQADEVEKSQYNAKELNAVRDKESCTAHGKEFNSFHRKMSSNPKKCFRCDGSYPHSGSCPAQNNSCNNCGKDGTLCQVLQIKNVFSKEGKGE